MTNILLVLSSPSGDASVSSDVAHTLVNKLKAAHAGANIVLRDVGRHPLGHIGEDFVNGRMLAADAQSASQKTALAISDEIIKEVFDADIIVIASAMINFSISSTLKSWLDHLIRMGQTFSYSENGPKGLVTGKKAYLVVARGGVYSEGFMQAYNFQEPYLKGVLGFIGISDIEVIAVEGLAMGPEKAAQTRADANAKILALAGV